MDLDAARKAPRAARRRADEGGDPAADKSAARGAWTVREAIEAYLASPDFHRKSEKTQLCDAGTLTNHVVYRLGGEKLSAVDVPTVRRLIGAIEHPAQQPQAPTGRNRRGEEGDARAVRGAHLGSR
jgi:hypothetical protein